MEAELRALEAEEEESEGYAAGFELGVSEKVRV